MNASLPVFPAGQVEEMFRRRVHNAPAGVPFSLAVRTGNVTTDTPCLALVDILQRYELAALALGAVCRVRRLDLCLLLKVPSPSLGANEWMVVGKNGLVTALCREQVRAVGGRFVAVDETSSTPVVVTATAVRIVAAQDVETGNANCLPGAVAVVVPRVIIFGVMYVWGRCIGLLTTRIVHVYSAQPVGDPVEFVDPMSR